MHEECDDPGVVPGPALIFHPVGAQTTLHVNQAAYVEVLLADLAQPIPGGDVDPVGVFLGPAFR